MQSQYINLLLDLPEVRIHQILPLSMDELRANAQQHSDFLQLTPKAVVMDLGKAYLTKTPKPTFGCN